MLNWIANGDKTDFSPAGRKQIKSLPDKPKYTNPSVTYNFKTTGLGSDNPEEYAIDIA